MMSESDEAPPRSSRTCPALHVTGGPPPLVQVDQPIIIPSYLVMVWALLFVSCPRGPVTKPDRVAARNGPETRNQQPLSRFQVPSIRYPCMSPFGQRANHIEWTEPGPWL